ncbi:MAG: DUF1376 domain-containing protein [Candidatus Thiodiazotropha endolucinida]
MSKKMDIFPLLIDRWLAGTRYLSHEERGAYLDLLLYLFVERRPIKDEKHVARILLADPRVSRKLWKKLCVKFTKNQHGYTHPLITKLIHNKGRIKGLDSVADDGADWGVEGGGTPPRNRNRTRKKEDIAKVDTEEVDSREGEISEDSQPPPAAAGIIAPSGFENTQPLVSVLANERFAYEHVHNPRSMIMISGWVKAGLTPENLSAVIAMTKSRNPNKPITSPRYLNGPVNDFLQALKSDNTENFGDWARVPTDENQLWPWAQKHGYPDPGRTESTRDYKTRLIRCVMDRKREFTESQKAKEG